MVWVNGHYRKFFENRVKCSSGAKIKWLGDTFRALQNISFLPYASNFLLIVSRLNKILLGNSYHWPKFTALSLAFFKPILCFSFFWIPLRPRQDKPPSRAWMDAIDSSPTEAGMPRSHWWSKAIKWTFELLHWSASSGFSR